MSSSGVENKVVSSPNVEFLLKQVYAAHRAEIKSLEEEMKTLKCSKCKNCEILKRKLCDIENSNFNLLGKCRERIDELEQHILKSLSPCKVTCDPVASSQESRLLKKHEFLNIGGRNSLDFNTNDVLAPSTPEMSPESLIVPLLPTENQISRVKVMGWLKSNAINEILPETVFESFQATIGQNNQEQPEIDSESERPDSEILAPISSIIGSEHSRVPKRNKENISTAKILTPFDPDETMLPESYQYKKKKLQPNIKIYKKKKGEILISSDEENSFVEPLPTRTFKSIENRESLDEAPNSQELLKAFAIPSPQKLEKDFAKDLKSSPIKKFLDNSFDRLPAKKSNFPTKLCKEETVRKHAERAQLNGFNCIDCAKYYGGLNLDESKLAERMKMCSRHRSVNPPPPATPDHFWDIGFPDTLECKQRGYLDETQHVKLKSRPKRILKKI